MRERLVGGRASALRPALLRPLLLAAAVIAALIGNFAVSWPILAGPSGLPPELAACLALPWWGLSALLAALAMVIANDPADSRPSLSIAGGLRTGWFVAAASLLAAAFLLSGDNRFTTPGVIAWIAGVACVVVAFTPRETNVAAAFRRGLAGMVRFPRHEPVAALALLLITALGAYARFHGLDRVPAEMTSDHIEKVLDAQRVVDGSRDIFFAGNGGREPIHFYAIALLASVSGGQVTFHTLKVAAAIESVLGIPALFLLARTLCGDRSRTAGTFLGLVAAAFVAVGYWHVVVARLSLRIMLTPLVVTLVLICIVRLIRGNRRTDAILLGLATGAGLYAYQSLRVIPILVVIGAGYMLVAVARSWPERRAIVANLLAAATVAFAVFVPLFRFSSDSPLEFWRRAIFRVVEKSGAAGGVMDAFLHALQQLGINMVAALGMFTYRSDIAWVQNAPGYPAFDPWMGSLLIVGAVAWTVSAFQRRDHAALFMPIAMAILLLPSALAIALPVENPSNTRASGAMPLAYLFAAFGIAAFAFSGRAGPGRRALVTVAAMAACVAGLAYHWTNRVIFGPYDELYQNSWKPQREVGLRLRDIAETETGWGNIFILASAHFFDWRGLAIEAGLHPGAFANGDIPPEELPRRLLDGLSRQAPFRLDPDRPIVVIHGVDDAGASATLAALFPGGTDTVVHTRMHDPRLTDFPYRLFRIPAPGSAGLYDILRGQGLSPAPVSGSTEDGHD